MDPTFPLAPVVNFLLALLLLLLLPCSFNSWSTALRIYTGWLALLCACNGINQIIWKDNVNDIAPFWCDFTSRLFVASSVAIPSSSFAIIRRLHYTTCTGRITMTHKEKRREAIVDIFLTLCFPFLVVGLGYIVQGHRYNIIEEVGCAITYVNTHLWYVLLLSWPLIFGCMSVLYAVRIVRVFLTQHKELNEVLTNESSRVNYNRFYRVFALTSTDTLFTIPLAIVIIYYDAVAIGPVIPWPGWAAVHLNFWRADTFPASLWRDPVYNSQFKISLGWAKFLVKWDQWIYALCALVFLSIYGTTREVLHYYSGVFTRAARLMGWKPKPQDIAEKAALSSSIIFQSTGPTTAGGTATVTWQRSSVLSGMSLSSDCEKSIDISDDSLRVGEQKPSAVKSVSDTIV